MITHLLPTTELFWQCSREGEQLFSSSSDTPTVASLSSSSCCCLRVVPPSSVLGSMRLGSMLGSMRLDSMLDFMLGSMLNSAAADVHGVWLTVVGVP